VSIELRELAQAGPWVWASLALGGIAIVLAVVGVTTLVLRRSSAFGIGLATLVFATLAAAAGIGGTVAERRALEFMAHTLAGTSAVSDHLLVVGYWHSRQSSWVGLWAALAPFIAGVVVAVLASRRVREGRIAGEAAGAGEQRSGRLLLAGLFSGLAALSLVGTVLVPRREPPV
jgi:membrane associated rhomboid family serine protease